MLPPNSADRGQAEGHSLADLHRRRDNRHGEAATGARDNSQTCWQEASRPNHLPHGQAEEDMSELARSTTLLLLLLNPFLVIVYLVDVVTKLEARRFAQVLVRAGLIASAVFCCFAILGDTIFSRIVQAEFASFQIFGGLVFLLIGFQFVFRGPAAIEILRGESEHLVGAIAMPVLIGPGTISASVIVGKRHDPLSACAAILVAVIASIVLILVLKAVHDFAQPHKGHLINRYIEIVGRIAALYVGTVSIDMIMQGVRTWMNKF